ncbi:GATA transcription factor 15-like [Diospyros lotus]|uniref:GATA transcription factor 15-like n=1 Tax=Diospyros lotus TaxID=55363 RepID=UPI00224E4508|nr:GATA transcription factor 15-like [Diospyros lotus]
MDLQEKIKSSSSSSSTTGVKKSCTDCHTTTTPLWRVGPAGPKSLCNACGIKYNKRRRALLGLDGGRAEKTKKTGKNKGKSKEGQPLKLRLMKEMVLQRSEKPRNKLGEVEKAALLLMALSCGSSVYA